MSACAFLAVAGASQRASAQEWLKDRRASEGEGIRAGNFELHPGIGGEIGYDSNYFLRSSKDGFVNSDPDGAGVLRITPSFSVSTLSSQRLDNGMTSPQAVTFRAGVSATYREFFGDEDIRKQRNVSLDANARVDVFQGRPIGFGAFATYQRLIQPSTAADLDLAFNQDTVSVGAEVVAIPGGGTFDARLGYTFSGTFFEEDNGVPYTNLTHEISARTRWKFRPRTALFHETSLRFISYPNADDANNRSLYFLNGSSPLRTRIGLTGLLTDRFGVLLAAGYGATFFQKPELGNATSQYDSMNAQAEGTFYLSRPEPGEPGGTSLLLSKLVFGFSRDFSNSLLGNYYTSDKGYLRLEYFFAGRALITLSGEFAALEYPQPYYQDRNNGNPLPVLGADGNPTGDFTNYRVGATLYGEYRFTNAFALTATVDYSQTISDTALDTAADTTAPAGGIQKQALYDLSWKRFQAFLGARLFF